MNVDDAVLTSCLYFLAHIHRLNKPYINYVKIGLEMCETRVWRVLGGIGVLGGLNPGFTHFGGLRGYFGPSSFSQDSKSNYQNKKSYNYIIYIEISISYYIYIYLYRGGAL
jgi:hypothetical protein